MYAYTTHLFSSLYAPRRTSGLVQCGTWKVEQLGHGWQCPTIASEASTSPTSVLTVPKSVNSPG